MGKRLAVAVAILMRSGSLDPVSVTTRGLHAAMFSIVCAFSRQAT
jgi:hypothetical protein